MVIAIGLALFALVQQDPNQDVISPRARAMLGVFPPPASGLVSIATRFSTDTVYAGEQVELVTATWFPRDLLQSLRHAPSLRTPSLSGLWSAQNSVLPKQALSRLVGGRIYDLYLTDQTLFPLEVGTVTAPPAELSYAVPTSSSFFAPETNHDLMSGSAVLVVRPIPASALATLGNGPTARDLTVLWRGPIAGLRVGTPATLELVVRGRGNVTLWPDPTIVWPASVHVYPERTDQAIQQVSGFVAGEKRFRFTVVADSPGVLTLPTVKYPFFNPSTRSVVVASAASFAFPVQLSNVPGGSRAMLPVDGDRTVPGVALVVDRFSPLLWLLASLPVLHWIWSRRRRVRPILAAPPMSDPELELRRLLGTPIDAAPDRVTRALRQRGIGREDAEAVRRWLIAAARKRYGPASAETLAAPDILAQVVARLRAAAMLGVLLLIGATPMRGQRSGIERYHGGDFPGAAVAFAQDAVEHPTAPGAWRDLAAARWLAGDDVGASAAWLNALNLAPRDPTARTAWHDAQTIPQDLRRLAPGIPLSRAELWLAAFVVWLLAWGCWLGSWRRLAGVALLIAVGLGGAAALRWQDDQIPRVILREGSTLRVSPALTAPVLGNPPAWTVAQVERASPGWLLIVTGRNLSGWIPIGAVAQLGLKQP